MVGDSMNINLVKFLLPFFLILGICSGLSSTNFHYVDGRYDQIKIDGNIYEIDGINQNETDYFSDIFIDYKYYVNFAERVDYELDNNGSIEYLSTLHITGDRINLRDFVLDQVAHHGN